MPSSLRLLVPLLAVLLTACASKAPTGVEGLQQTGALKVHPGLLGLPVPPELQVAEDKQQVARVDVSGDKTTTPTDSPKSKFQLGENGIPGDNAVYFDFREAVLKPQFAALLAAHASYLAQNPKARIRVEGHADERGPDDINQRLGLERAAAVRADLIKRGANIKQIKPVSLGKSKPKAAGHDEASWAENRRAEILYEREK